MIKVVKTDVTFHSLLQMWVQFTNPCSLDQWIHYFFIGPHSFQLVNSLKIQWNHLAYRDTFYCSDFSIEHHVSINPNASVFLLVQTHWFFVGPNAKTNVGTIKKIALIFNTIV